MSHAVNASTGVRIWEEPVSIPTYPVPPADRNPMFLEKRVYQGSSGRVYPNAFTDRVSDEKIDRLYRGVFLENEFIRLMILPEIGGRIHIGQDKTNGYDFFYRQTVIKPALVGLLGPWISGGVEFNWPQHHRPTTFMPVHHVLEHAADGSCTVWLSEHEPMNRMKGMVGICLHPGKAFVEARVRLYNRTPFVKTFLWWANAAVHANEAYQSFFPPDVTHVADHARRAMSAFPIARNFYYGADYTGGVDITWYKNIPVPTSYMVCGSQYDFFGGYDHNRNAGVVHVADRHIAPGKKQWTWGNADFGHAWDRNLTDSDGPYIELMAGVYTDNQPDFSWLHPFETRTFSQFWYPIQQIGPAKNANRLAAISLDVRQRRVRVGVCVTEAMAGLRILLRQDDRAVLDHRCDVAPGNPFVRELLWKSGEAAAFDLRVISASGREIISYRAEKPGDTALPAAASEPDAPAATASSDRLYLAGVHLEQYRHATRSPEPYWNEALRRDPLDARSNNALGIAQLRRGLFPRAEQHFRAAIERLTERNGNPYDGEPHYNLGLALKYQRRTEEAHAAFAKATWNCAWQSAAHYSLATLDCARGDVDAALEHLQRALRTNTDHLKARNLHAAILRRTGRNDQAAALVRETLLLDPLDFWARAEQWLDSSTEAAGAPQLIELLSHDAQTALDVAFDYSDAGFIDDAARLLDAYVEGGGDLYPIVLYALSYFHDCLGHAHLSAQHAQRAATACPDYCFPSRLEEMSILEWMLARNGKDAKAAYYLGNLLYDRRRYDEAIARWEQSAAIDPSFSICWRNLGIAYFNIGRDAEKARNAYERARVANPEDARLLYELDQLDKRTGADPAERLHRLEANRALVSMRDDLSVELVTLYNQTGQSRKALELVSSRRFHPWEGGEGLVSGQFVWAHFLIGRALLEKGDAAGALAHFDAARQYPHNLGEGKHLLTPEVHLDYASGCAAALAGQNAEALQFWNAAALSGSRLPWMRYCKSLALCKTGQPGTAREELHDMKESAERQLQAETKIDYFATSLPNFLLFEDDLARRNRVDCLFAIALAEAGLGNRDVARERLREVLSLDCNHHAAQEELRAAAFEERAR